MNLLLPIPVKNLGDGKKLHNYLPIKNGLFFSSTDFSSWRFFLSLFSIPFRKDEYAVKIKYDSNNYQKFFSEFSLEKTGLWFSY